MQYLWPRK